MVFCSAIKMLAPDRAGGAGSPRSAGPRSAPRPWLALVEQKRLQIPMSACARSPASPARRRKAGRPAAQWLEERKDFVDAHQVPVVLHSILLAAISRLSSTLCSGNTCRSSGTKPTPAFAIRCGLHGTAMSRPTTTWPRRGGASPAITLSILPAPLRASSAIVCPSASAIVRHRSVKNVDLLRVRKRDAS